MVSFLDTPTVLLGSTTIRVAVAAGLFVYSLHQATCPGFRSWILGTAASAVSRASLLLAHVHPTASLVVNLQVQTLASLLLLDGVRRYLGHRPLDRRWYGLPVLGLGVTGWLASEVPPFLVVSLWAAGVIGAVAAVGGLLWLRPGGPEGRSLRWTAAGINFGFVALLALRAGLGIRLAPSPEALAAWEGLFYLVGGILDMMCLALFVMLDGRYLEDRLQASRSRLESTFEELQRSIERVRMLSGILPSCAGCQKIREEDDSWTPLEDYLAHRTRAQIHRDRCPECHGSSEDLPGVPA